MIWLYCILGGLAAYLLMSLLLAYLVHGLPRNPVHEPPDWGSVLDTRIPAPDGGSLEVWRVEPDAVSRGIVVLVHGWGRNRDRMVPRARLLGKLGFTTVMHSSRDHGASSPYRFMNPIRFAEDVEALLDWIGEPVVLYGHSAGAAGALVAAVRNPNRIQLLILEGCYAETKEGLRSLYRANIPLVGPLFARMIVFWMDLFYRFRLDEISPSRLASQVHIPVLIVHGERDPNFPLHHARRLRDSFPACGAELFVGREAGHSDSSLTADFPMALRAFLNRHL
jgi:pimeloyl-ACP methyl ester carboxylesterase